MRRLLIIGCGDVALRLVPLVQPRYRIIYGLTRDGERRAALRASGVRPILGDLDRPATLTSLPGLAHDVVHCAPPPPAGSTDTRTAHLVAALARGGSLPQQLVYISTSGVYGDASGALVDETFPLAPQTPRAQRRADAERRLRKWGARSGVRVTILRAPGIYATERLPLARLERRTPALRPEDDAYVNHIHADDLARCVAAALRRALNRTYNAADDTPLKMGDYFDLVADRFGLPRPVRIPREEARRVIEPTLYSFMNESRRLVNERMKRELRVALQYPSVHEGIAAARGAASQAVRDRGVSTHAG
jgi:nucleoside-diphosphate-sugar epimerase